MSRKKKKKIVFKISFNVGQIMIEFLGNVNAKKCKSRERKMGFTNVFW